MREFYLLHKFTRNGSLGMSYKVFEEITRFAIREVQGATLNDNPAFLFNVASPITCRISKNGDLAVKINLRIKYGFNVSEVSNLVQSKVEESIYNMTEIHPSKIDIHVEDIK